MWVNAESKKCCQKAISAENLNDSYPAIQVTSLLLSNDTHSRPEYTLDEKAISMSHPLEDQKSFSTENIRSVAETLLSLNEKRLRNLEIEDSNHDTAS